MSDTPQIRTLAAQEWQVYKRLRLRALADSPAAFGRTLAEEQGRTDAEWLDRLASGADTGWDLPLVAEVAGEPVGLAWGRISESEPGVAHLYQMWVAPGHRRRGIGRLLLETVIAWAGAKDASSLDLGVTAGDSPAQRLYRRAGFEPVGAPEPIRPGAALLSQPMRLKLRRSAA